MGREPYQMNVSDVVHALHGEDLLGEVAENGKSRACDWAISNLHQRVNHAVRVELQRTTLADLVSEVHKLDESQSLMLGL